MLRKYFLSKLMLIAIILIPAPLVACGQNGEIANKYEGNTRCSIAPYNNQADNMYAGFLPYAIPTAHSWGNFGDDKHSALISNIFIGCGETLSGGGDGFDWFHGVFGHDFNFISGHYIAIVGSKEFAEWTRQFEGHGQDAWRNPREATLRSFIEDFGISIEQIIEAEEELRGMSMQEINELVEWSRTIEIRPFERNDETRKAMQWSTHVLTLSDIQSLFSNDVNEIWAAFPGYGTLHNNRAYSPEWLFHNIERATYGELIPLSELEGVIYTAVNRFGFVGNLLDTAKTTLQTAQHALTNPTPQQLSFNLNSDPTITPFSASPVPATIPPITLNTWDAIMDSLELGHLGIPIGNPTRTGYHFMGWYLDADFTVAITEVFRMPARNATLYARWENH